MKPMRFSANAKPGRPRGAFTLIELLVVLAILSLLVAILTPSIGRAMTLARRAICLTNLRTLGNAGVLFATANDNYFPQALDYNVHRAFSPDATTVQEKWIGIPLEEQRHLWWFRSVPAYASGSEESWPEGTMTCPSSDKRTVNDSIAWSTANFDTLPVERLSWRANVKGNTVWCSYGQNYFLRPLKEPNSNFMYGGRYLPWDGIQHSWPCQDTNIGTLPSPASTVFYGDNKWDHGGVSPIWGDRWQGGWRHDWYKNYVHFDGHAESVHLLEEPANGSRDWMMKWRGMANW